MKTQYYTATSLDGFIATEDDSLDWLTSLGDPAESSYPDFISRVGALAMGSATYEWLLEHSAEVVAQMGAAWPYSQPAWVFTHRGLPAIPGADVRFVQGDVRRAHQQMRAAAGAKNVWVVGGGDLAGQFHDAGLLDELIVQVAPVTLGRGKPLFPRRLAEPAMRLTEVRRFGPGFVELRYDLRGDVGAGRRPVERDAPVRSFTDKSSVDDIRRRFDADVERFSNLETGQTATVDAALALGLVAEAAARVTPGAKRLLDVGCGAGNFTLRTLQELPGLDVTLVDLSEPMLARARERVGASSADSVRTLQGDVRDIELAPGSFDVIIAAAVLHHLRDDADWDAVVGKLAASLTPGGAIWVFDMVEADHPAVHELAWRRYGDYLAGLRDTAYRDNVFAYIAREDTPRSLMYQLDLLRRHGLAVDVLHVNTGFAAFGGVKPA